MFRGATELAASHRSCLKLADFKTKRVGFCRALAGKLFLPKAERAGPQKQPSHVHDGYVEKFSLSLNQSDQFQAGIIRRLCRLAPRDTSPGHAQQASCCQVTTRLQAESLPIHGAMQVEAFRASVYKAALTCGQDFSTHLISFNSYSHPVKHTFCTLTVEGKAY